ncbi:hypothetical protein BDV12DRAFT_202986 [Aspergillus spectabilis]
MSTIFQFCIVSRWRTADETATGASDEIGVALQVLPPRPYLDALVQSYLSGPNYQYYIIYPPPFSKDYATWWEDRVRGRKPDRAMTCLLLRVCACSTQAPSDSLRATLENELGENLPQLSKRYHTAARSLSSSIGAGKGGLVHVQQLFLTSWWLKGDAQFVDSWHLLAAAIHEAQKLGLHDKKMYPAVDEFEEEMGRRVWCVLYVCESLLSRPRIVDNSCCSFDPPDLHLDTTDAGQDCPSPITHMVLLCQLFQTLSADFVPFRRELSVDQIFTLQQIVSDWLATCPSIYKTTEKPRDDEPPYVRLQRWTIQVPAYLLMLQPLKPYLTTKPGHGSSETHRHLQVAAVRCALNLADSSAQLAQETVVYVTNLHTAVFTLFDATAVLCSSILHDRDHCLPQREKVIEAIGRGVRTMGELSEISRTAVTAHNVLSHLIRTPGLAWNERDDAESACADRLAIGTPRLSGVRSSIGPDKSSGSMLPSPGLHRGESEIASVKDLQLGQLGEMWSWHSLDFDL